MTNNIPRASCLRLRLCIFVLLALDWLNPLAHKHPHRIRVTFWDANGKKCRVFALRPLGDLLYKKGWAYWTGHSELILREERYLRISKTDTLHEYRIFVRNPPDAEHFLEPCLRWRLSCTLLERLGGVKPHENSRDSLVDRDLLQLIQPAI